MTIALRRSMVGALAALLIVVAQASGASGWSGPRSVGTSTSCGQVSAAIDSTGSNYVAAACNDYVRVSYNKGLVWTTVQFGHPADRFDLGPQIAIDGGRLYVAFTRMALSECGLEPLGVYFRQRNLPTGAWSPPTRLGYVGDRLHSFRIVDGITHASVWNGGSVFYERTESGIVKRYPLAGAVGTTSLDVGNDGIARIVYNGEYNGEGGLRYAVFLGSSFKTSLIPGTDENDRDPQLVLDADNRAHVVWTHTSETPGCGAYELDQLDGTYYATNISGAWSASVAAGKRRVTRNVGRASLTVDVSTGRPHIAVGGNLGVNYYTPGSRKWNGVSLSSHVSFDVAIRLNQANGTLFVAYVRQIVDPSDGPNLYYLTKP